MVKIRYTDALLYPAAFICAWFYKGEFDLSNAAVFGAWTCAATAFMVAATRHGPRASIPLRSPLLITLLVLCAWLLTTTLVNPALHVGIHRTSEICLSVLLALAYRATVTGAAVRVSNTAFGLLFVVLMAIVLSQVWQSNVNTSAVFQNRNTYAGILNLALFPAAGYTFLAVVNNELRRAFAGTVFLALVLITQILIGSRGALLGMLTGGIAAVFLAGPVLMRAASAAARRTTAWVSVIIATLVLGIDQMAERSMSSRLIASLSNPASAFEDRLVIWRAAIDMIATRPMVGHGPGSFWLAYPAFRSPADFSAGFHAHNDLLQYAVEAGIPAAVLLVLVLATAIATLWRVRQRESVMDRERVEASMLIAGLLAFSAHSLFTYNTYIPADLVLVGLYLGRSLQLSVPLADQMRPARSGRGLLAVAAVLLVPVVWFAMLTVAGVYYQRAASEEYPASINQKRQWLDIAQTLAPLSDVVHLTRADLEYLTYLQVIEQLGIPAAAKDFETAVSHAETATTMNGHRADGFFLRAQLAAVDFRLPEVARMQTAVAFYQAGIARRPSAIDEQLELGDLLAVLGQVNDALAVYRAGIVWCRYYDCRLRFLLHIYRTLVSDGNYPAAADVELEIAKVVAWQGRDWDEIRAVLEDYERQVRQSRGE